MEIPILRDIAIIFGISIGVLFLCAKIKVPPIIGFLITGTIVGPHGMHWISSIHEVEILAEVGIVMLMFTIGLDLSIKELTHNKKAVLLGGSVQVLLTIGVVLLIGLIFGISLQKAIFIGFLITLSSTAIVLELLHQKGQSHSSHGKTALAILVFQDIISVIMILLIPLLQTDSDLNILSTFFILFLKAIVIIALVVVCTKYIVPTLLFQIARTKNQDLFLLCIAAMCMVIAWSASTAGLSLGLGAFLAGLIISESEYSLRAMGSVLPFRSVFLSFFFVSVGTLFDISFLFQNFGTIILLVLALILIKVIVLFIVCVILKTSMRNTILLCLTLSQIGEFSFMLSKIGMDGKLLNDMEYQNFLSVTIFSMALTPVLIYIAPILADWLNKKLMRRSSLHSTTEKSKINIEFLEHKLEYHLVIIGYGLHGRLMAKTAREMAIPYVILELDSDIVKAEREKGEPIIYGDATHEKLLQNAYVKNAFLVIISTHNLRISQQILSLINNINKAVHVIALTHLGQEVEPLIKAGADSVVSTEFEAAIEVQRQMMTHFLLPPDEIVEYISRIREDGYNKIMITGETKPINQTDIDNLFG